MKVNPQLLASMVAGAELATGAESDSLYNSYLNAGGASVRKRIRVRHSTDCSLSRSKKRDKNRLKNKQAKKSRRRNR